MTVLVLFVFTFMAIEERKQSINSNISAETACNENVTGVI